MAKHKARRGRGEGSIRERTKVNAAGQVVKWWEATLRLGNGKRRTVTGETKAEVLERLRQAQLDAGQGLTQEAATLTLGQWLTRWLAGVKPTVEPNTYGPYERHCRLHLAPHLGTLKLAKVKAAHIKGLYTTLSECGVSAAMQRKIGTTLTMALNEAFRLDLLAGNPAEKVRKPIAAKTELQPLGVDQTAKLLAAARTDRLYAFYRTALDSGARPGELFALQWSDIDFERGCLSITKSLEYIAGALRVKEPKTARGRRRVDLSADTLVTLQEHRRAMLAAGLIAGPVFCDTAGGYLRIENLRRDSFKPILIAAGLPDVRLYDLRHTCATLLLLGDVAAKVVSERLGHSSVTLTLDTYSHVLPTMQKRAASVLGQLLGKNGGTMAVQGGLTKPMESAQSEAV